MKEENPTINFTAEISDTETIFLDTNTAIYKGEGFKSNSVLEMRTHFKPTETFQHSHFSSCHQPGVKKGFVKGEALRLVRTNSSKDIFEQLIQIFKSRLRERGYPKNLAQRTLSEAKFKNGTALLQKPQESKRIFPVSLHNTSQQRRHKTNPHERLAFNRATTVAQRNLKLNPNSYITKTGRSIKYILARAKLQK